jgi:hypothetical protein
MVQHLLIKMPMQKGVGYVELIDEPILVGGDGEHRAHSAQFDHRRKGFTEVNPCAMGEATNNPFGLVLLEAAVGLEFMLQHPLPSYDISTQWARHQHPRLVVSRVSYSVCMAAHQLESASALRTVVGSGDRLVEEIATMAYFLLG